MRFLGIFARFFVSLGSLIEQAHEFGALTFTETDLADGRGWTVSIRPKYAAGGPHYAWTGQAATMKLALLYALRNAREEPEMKSIRGSEFRPKLGGSDNDG